MGCICIPSTVAAGCPGASRGSASRSRPAPAHPRRALPGTSPAHTVVDITGGATPQVQGVIAAGGPTDPLTRPSERPAEQPQVPSTVPAARSSMRGADDGWYNPAAMRCRHDRQSGLQPALHDDDELFSIGRLDLEEGGPIPEASWQSRRGTS
jgi:hypothetical protein